MTTVAATDMLSVEPYEALGVSKKLSSVRIRLVRVSLTYAFFCSDCAVMLVTANLNGSVRFMSVLIIFATDSSLHRNSLVL